MTHIRGMPIRLKPTWKNGLRMKVCGGHDKVIECFAIEHFYGGISEERKLWLEDRLT